MNAIRTFRDLVKTVLIYTRNVLVWICPFVIFVLALGVPVYFLRSNFESYLKLLSILIWPLTILLALFFFRKVVTYLFFTMNEFNFFGAKGELKDVKGMIEERVEKRIREEKDNEKSRKEIESFAAQLEAAKREGTSHQKTADEQKKEAEANLQLARKIFGDLQDLSQKNAEMLKELESYRQKETERKQRHDMFLERMKRRRHPDQEGEDLPPEKRPEEKSTLPSSTDSTNDTIRPKNEL